MVEFYVEFEQDLNLAIECYVSLMNLIRFNSIISILWSFYDSKACFVFDLCFI